MIYTSGSTGEPKIIQGAHKSLSHFIHWEVKEFELDSDVRVSLLAPISFDVGLRDIFVPLLAGGTLCIPHETVKQQPESLANWISEKEITLMHIVPTLFKGLTKLIQDSKGKKKELASLKYVLLAGEALYGVDVNKWYKNDLKGITLVNLYGPSETTLAKLFYRIPMKEFDAGTVIPLGNPISNTTILILNSSRQ